MKAQMLLIARLIGSRVAGPKTGALRKLVKSGRDETTMRKVLGNDPNHGLDLITISSFLFSLESAASFRRE